MPSLRLVLLVVGCGAAAAQELAPGEEMVLQVRYLGVHTGEGRVVVGEPEGDVWPVIFQARTAGVVRFLDIREHLVLYWDSAKQLPRGTDLRSIELGDFHQDTTRFDRANGRARLTIRRNGRESSKTFDVAPGTFDLPGVFVWLRLQPLAPGARHELPVCSGDAQFTVVAEVVGRETLKTPAGTFPSVRITIRTGFKGNFSTKRETVLWLSDDPRHVLVQASAEFAVGSVVATLRRYTPGRSPAAVRH